MEAHEPLDELASTLLYKVSAYPYRQILAAVQDWPEKDKSEAIDIALRHRSPHDELLREFHCGYRFIFDILMDLGSWRDLHRHRGEEQREHGTLVAPDQLLGMPLHGDAELIAVELDRLHQAIA